MNSLYDAMNEGLDDMDDGRMREAMASFQRFGGVSDVEDFIEATEAAPHPKNMSGKTATSTASGKYKSFFQWSVI